MAVEDITTKNCTKCDSLAGISKKEIRMTVFIPNEGQLTLNNQSNRSPLPGTTAVFHIKH